MSAYNYSVGTLLGFDNKGTKDVYIVCRFDKIHNGLFSLTTGIDFAELSNNFSPEYLEGAKFKPLNKGEKGRFNFSLR